MSLFASGAYAAQLTLAWEGNQEADLAGYRIYLGSASHAYVRLIDVRRGTIDPTDNSVFCTLTGLTKGVRYYAAASAYDGSGNESPLSSELSFRIPLQGETISAPGRPLGPAEGIAGTPSVFRASQATSSEGHSLQYRFLWGDGTASPWLRVGDRSVRKSWAEAGTYRVRVQARCAAHRLRQSIWSKDLSVTVGSAP